MEQVIHNIFLINNIDLLDDIQGIIKNTLLSCSCIKIIPPTLEEWGGNDSFTHCNLTFTTAHSKFNDDSIMSLGITNSKVYYHIGISNKLIYLCIKSLNTNNLYIGNKTQWKSFIHFPCNYWKNFKEIIPIYYFN